MTEGDQMSLTVDYVEGGDALPADHGGVQFRAVEADAASDGWRSVDRAVLIGGRLVFSDQSNGGPMVLQLRRADDGNVTACR